VEGPHDGVREEEGVGRPPPREEVDVLEQRDAIVDGEAAEGKGHQGVLRGSEEHQRREDLEGGRADGGEHEQDLWAEHV